jgi:hypothetical protein
VDSFLAQRVPSVTESLKNAQELSMAIFYGPCDSGIRLELAPNWSLLDVKAKGESFGSSISRSVEKSG